MPKSGSTPTAAREPAPYAPAMGVVVMVNSSPTWAVDFDDLHAQLEAVLGAVALRIDHIGSSSVPGLAAKDVIDVQVTVADEEGLREACRKLGTAGFPASAESYDHPVPGESETRDAWTKGFATERAGDRRANIHVRVLGRPNQKYALLFRDYLRSHPDTASAYSAFKARAAELLPEDSATYANLKDPVCDLIYIPAKVWAESTGWSVTAAKCE